MCSLAGQNFFNPLDAELNPLCQLLALLGAHHILHISRIKLNTPASQEIMCLREEILYTFNLLKPNDIYIYIYLYICRTAALTSRPYILNIYSTNIHTEYFKRAA